LSFLALSLYLLLNLLCNSEELGSSRLFVRKPGPERIVGESKVREGDGGLAGDLDKRGAGNGFYDGGEVEGVVGGR
jgi:hypothetical protein